MVIPSCEPRKGGALTFAPTSVGTVGFYSWKSEAEMVDVATLGEQVRGEVLTSGDEEYDDARRVYNAMHDRHPEVVIQAADEADVIAAVRFARDNDLELAVRGGGHSVPGYGTSDGGLVIDLARIRFALVDPGGG